MIDLSNEGAPQPLNSMAFSKRKTSQLELSASLIIHKISKKLPGRTLNYYRSIASQVENHVFGEMNFTPFSRELLISMLTVLH